MNRTLEFLELLGVAVVEKSYKSAKSGFLFEANAIVCNFLINLGRSSTRITKSIF